MIGRKLIAASIIALVVGASAVGIAAGTGEAPNRNYSFGQRDRDISGTPGPGWREALSLRSEGLNRKYGLGDYAPTRTEASSMPDWARALQLRSEALDRKYKLGKYAAK